MAIRKSSIGGTPFGTTANRPSSPQVGQTYYNGDLGYLEIYTSAGWIPASGGNDFNLNLTGTYTTVTFSQSYSAGSYSITSGSNDGSVDIYAFASDGSSAGYTNTKSFTATQRFNKMVIIGGTNSDVLGFSYKTTYPTSSTTSEIGSGPFIISISPSFMANVDDTVTITGGNFANDVQVAFTGTGYTSTPAKNIVRSSASSLIVTRPDNFPLSASPFTVTVTNPGVNAPVSTNAHISSNSITAGVGPVWNTGATLPTFTRNVAYSTLLSASDADSGGSITYSFVSGSLPTGITFTALTGAVSGTPTTSLQTTFTIRATDAGGNFVDRTFTLPNASPVWSTSSGALTNAQINTSYSNAVVATDDSGNTPTYSIVSGSLPSGLSINSSTGAITGTPTVGSSGTPSSFTVRATDINGNNSDRTFTIYVLSQITTRFTSSGSWTVPTGVTSANIVLVAGGGGGGRYPGSNVGSGGGGAGGVLHYQNQSVTPGSVLSFTVGGGGAPGASGGGATNYSGGSTTFTGLTSALGGGSGNGGGTGGIGGSGGGARSGSGGAGTAGQGNAGGNSSDQDAGGGGGGASAAGGNTTGVQSANAGAGGAGVTLYGFTVGGGGGGGHSDRAGYPGSSPFGAGAGGAGGGGQGGHTSLNGGVGVSGTANTGGGGGGSGSDNSGSTGGSGCVIINYLG